MQVFTYNPDVCFADRTSTIVIDISCLAYFLSLFNIARRLFRPAVRGPQDRSHRARTVLTLQIQFEMNGTARKEMKFMWLRA